MPLRLLVTGASGFVGRVVCAQALRRGLAVSAAVRNHVELPDDIEPIPIGEINGLTDWGGALRDVDIVVHLAARVHVMYEEAPDPLAAFRSVNVAGTENLARAAAASGVRRMVYVSSVKVNGEATYRSAKFTEIGIPCQQDPYGQSKYEAEQALHRIAAETGMEVVIVRPPLVYGPGVKGNYIQMLKALAKGLPLPLSSVHNQRSLIYVENLADALIVCALSPAAAGQTYLVSDGEDISTSQLLRRLGGAMGKPARLFSCPPSLLNLAGRLFGRSAEVERLLGSLQVDSGKIRSELNWTPPYSLQQGLQTTAEWYRNTHL